MNYVFKLPIKQQTREKILKKYHGTFNKVSSIRCFIFTLILGVILLGVTFDYIYWLTGIKSILALFGCFEFSLFLHRLIIQVITLRRDNLNSKWKIAEIIVSNVLEAIFCIALITVAFVI